MFLVGHVSGLFENFHTGVFPDTINVIKVILCKMVLHIELYLFTTRSVTFTLHQVHSSVKQF